MKPFEIFRVKCIVFSFRLGKGTAVATVPFLFYAGLNSRILRFYLQNRLKLTTFGF